MRAAAASQIVEYPREPPISSTSQPAFGATSANRRRPASGPTASERSASGTPESCSRGVLRLETLQHGADAVVEHGSRLAQRRMARPASSGSRRHAPPAPRKVRVVAAGEQRVTDELRRALEGDRRRAGRRRARDAPRRGGRVPVPRRLPADRRPRPDDAPPRGRARGVRRPRVHAHLSRRAGRGHAPVRDHRRGRRRPPPRGRGRRRVPSRRRRNDRLPSR